MDDETRDISDLQILKKQVYKNLKYINEVVKLQNNTIKMIDSIMLQKCNHHWEPDSSYYEPCGHTSKIEICKKCGLNSY